MDLKDTFKKYLIVVLAQLCGFGIAWFLTTYVFLGPIPAVQADFAERVKELPSEISAYVSSIELPQRGSSRSEDPEEYPDGYFPGPFVLRIPTPPGGATPTSRYQVPNDPTPEPTRQSRIPIPTIFQRDPTSAPTSAPTDVPTPTAVPTSRPTATPTPAVPEQRSSPSTLEKQTVDEINRRRSSMGLSTLKVSGTLVTAARQHSEWMAQRPGLERCGHTGAGGSTPFDRVKKVGHRGRLHGETVACIVSTANMAVTGWWGSPPHKAILTTAGVTEIGVGWSGNKATALVGY